MGIDIPSHQKIPEVYVNHLGAREYSSKYTREYPRGVAVKLPEV